MVDIGTIAVPCPACSHVMEIARHNSGTTHCERCKEGFSVDKLIIDTEELAAIASAKILNDIAIEQQTAKATAKFIQEEIRSVRREIFSMSLILLFGIVAICVAEIIF